MGTMLGLTLRQMTGRRRLGLLVFLAALPVAITALLTALTSSDGGTNDGDFVNAILNGMLITAILPIVVMTLATAAFGNELEDRTLNVIVLKPISRFAIVLPKFLGSVLVAGPLAVASGVISVAIAMDDAGPRALLAAAVAILTAVIPYAAVFTWSGLITSRALGFALVYVFLWEGLVTGFLSGVRYLSIRGYSLSILRGLDPEAYFSLQGTIEFPAAIGGAVIVTVLFFYLTVRRLQRMDIP